MDLNVYDAGFQKVAILDSFTSLMWCKRYNEIGALDLEIEANAETLNVLKKGYYITRDDDDSIFRIEAIELDTTAEGDDVLIVGAFDCQKILDQRIIWQQINWNGTVENYIRSLVTNAIISPNISARTISNFILKAAHGFTETVKQQATYDNVGEKIAELCQTYGYGYKITRENGNWCFDLYKGTDRSVDQAVNPRVLFSSDFENLISSKYNVDVSDFRNVALIGGEGEGTDRKTRTIGNASGIDRHELFVDASGVSSNDGEIDLPTYYENLIAEGKEKLAEHGTTTSFEGEVDAESYKYKTDYNLGDVVTIRNQYGISVNARITEIIETWDAEGYTIEPKFEYMEIEEPAEIDGALLTENNRMMLTQSGSPLLAESAPASSEGVKISELEEAETLYDGCCFPIVQNGETKKVQKSTLQQTIIDVAYPVGSLYWSSNPTDPAELFGVGTWTPIKDRFVWAKGDNDIINDTGGEKTHTLTVDEMPAHDHSYTGSVTFASGTVANYYAIKANGSSQDYSTISTSSPKGGGQPHNNMPPYVVKYCWERTA